MRIAVTGSTGLVGAAVVSELKRRGDQVVPVVRRAATGDEISWDIEAGSIDGDRFESVDAVVHLAGENIAAGRWTQKQKARIRDSRVKGTELLCRALADLQQPPATLISASAVGYYGDRGDEICDEQSPPGDGFLPKVCVAWEGAARPAWSAGIRVVHPRLGVVLAAHDGALKTMLTPFRLGVGGRLGSGRQYMSWITLPELVNVILFALGQENVRGAINATSPNPVTNLQFTKALGRAIHRPTILPAPAFALRTLLGEMANELLLSSTRAVPAHLQQLGYKFLHPDLDSGLQAVLGKR